MAARPHSLAPFVCYCPNALLREGRGWGVLVATNADGAMVRTALLLSVVPVQGIAMQRRLGSQEGGLIDTTDGAQGLHNLACGLYQQGAVFQVRAKVEAEAEHVRACYARRVVAAPRLCRPPPPPLRKHTRPLVCAIGYSGAASV